MQRAITSPVTRQLSDGNEYTFAPIGPAIWSEFCAWINQCEGRPIRKLVGLDEMVDSAQSIDGMTWLCWKAATRHHKGMTLPQFRDLASMADLMELTPALIDLPDQEGSDPPEAASL